MCLFWFNKFLRYKVVPMYRLHLSNNVFLILVDRICQMRITYVMFFFEHENEHVFKIAFRKSRMVNIKSRIIIHDI